jgi:serine/threonine-protein kinase
MGTVHLMFRVGDPECFFVLKRMRRGLLRDTEALRRFRHEATLSQCVDHRNLVRTFCAGEDDQGLFLVLEYIHGTHLMDLSDRALLTRRRLSWPSVVGAGVQALEGLIALHEGVDEQGNPLGILHRDLSPQNLLVEDTGRVVLSDFGISKSRLSTLSTDASHMLGKLAYLTPEYLRQAQSSTAGDVYSLAVTLWVLLIGRVPFSGRSETEMLLAIITDGVPPLHTLRAEAPAALSALLSAATSMKDTDRPTAREFHSGLLSIWEGRGDHLEVVQSEVDGCAGSDLAIKRQVYLRQARLLHAR